MHLYIFSCVLLCNSNSFFVSNNASQSSIIHLKHFTKFEFLLFLFKRQLKALNDEEDIFSESLSNSPEQDVVSF